MYLTIHTPASLIIGSQINSPIWAFVLAFMVHFIFDAIPHDYFYVPGKPDKKSFKILIYATLIDGLLILILLFVLWQNNALQFNFSILAALAGTFLVDVLWGFNILTKRKVKFLKAYHYFHSKVMHTLIYKKGRIPLVWVIIIQGSVFIITLWIYLKII